MAGEPFQKKRKIEYSRERQVIDDIRASYSSGDIDDKGHKSKNTLADLLGALTEKIFTKHFRFIYELLQNAEDNKYHPNVQPKFSVKLLQNDFTNTPGSKGILIITNNEVGFTEENVRALCSIGHSTKKLNKDENIGEKGFGFKSVFKVSNYAYLFSNKFYFSLSTLPDPETKVPYISPQWIHQSIIDYLGPINGTVIALPIKASMHRIVVDSLTKLDANSILFLHKITSLEIEVEAVLKRSFMRDETDNHITKLLADGKEYQYWKRSETINVPVNMKEKNRDGVRRRQVRIAFPLDDVVHTEDINVFAFLPTSEKRSLASTLTLILVGYHFILIPIGS